VGLHEVRRAGAVAGGGGGGVRCGAPSFATERGFKRAPHAPRAQRRLPPLPPNSHPNPHPTPPRPAPPRSPPPRTSPEALSIVDCELVLPPQEFAEVKRQRADKRNFSIYLQGGWPGVDGG
jgi:hypothetical protein